MTPKTSGIAAAFAWSLDKSATADVGAAKQAPCQCVVSCYTDPEVRQQLRMPGLELGEAKQALMTEALNTPFAKRCKPPVAQLGLPRRHQYCWPLSCPGEHPPL